MRATILLCDFAAVADGKLYISGGGWNLLGPQPTQTAIAIKLDVPWHQANTKIQFKLELVSQDGTPVLAPGPAGQTPVQVAGEFEVGRPPGVTPGSSIDVPLAFNFPPLPLALGQRFEWRLSINGETEEDWWVAFSTRAAPPGMSTYVVNPPEEN